MVDRSTVIGEEISEIRGGLKLTARILLAIAALGFGARYAAVELIDQQFSERESGEVAHSSGYVDIEHQERDSIYWPFGKKELVCDEFYATDGMSEPVSVRICKGLVDVPTLSPLTNRGE